MRRGRRPIDTLAAAFAVAFAAIVAATARQSPAWPWHLAAAALTLALVAAVRRADPDTPFLRFMGPVYPLFLVTAFYTAVGTLNQDLARNYDPVIQRLETALFAGDPSLTWHHAWPSAALSWVLHLCYVSYYPIVVAVALWHWRRATPAHYECAAFAIALGFFACYLVFALFPVAGPRYFYGPATGAAADVPAAVFVNRLLAGGSAYGTAFPSSHIAVTWIAVMVTWRSSRRLALALWPVAIGLALGTVYGQFHYAVDAVAGVLAAVVLYGAAAPLYRRLSVDAASSTPHSQRRDHRWSAGSHPIDSAT